MTSIDNLAEEIMQGLQEYADLADTAMKKAVRKTATQVKNEISANAPKDTGKYAKSWATKKTGENSHSLEMTVHSKNISTGTSSGKGACQAWRWSGIRQTAHCSCGRKRCTVAGAFN